MAEPRPNDVSSPERLRELLHRHSLDTQRFRATVARSLRISDTEVAALAQLSLGHALSPGQLGGVLGLTSGGTAAMLKRLERRDYVSRNAHPMDHRSTLLSLTTTAAADLGERYRRLVQEVDESTRVLSDEQRAVIADFLDAATEATAAATEVILREQAAHKPELAALPHPGLWA